jgi:UDP-2,4-diacetamido-2,4,6-trideoxy-beta-L-altropyranose hydrolase
MGANLEVIFRTDASHQIGTGHVMRCLTLADALRERGCECRFICREHPGNLLKLIRQRGHVAFALPQGEVRSSGSAPADGGPAHADWLGTHWKIDAEQTRVAVGGVHVDWLIVDHYALDIRWEQHLRPICHKLMVIDDLADRLHDCDLLLDQNLIADADQRYVSRVPPHCGLILGPRYALLQPQYAQLHIQVQPRQGPIRQVLIYFGGSDSDNLTGKAIAAFLSLQRNDIGLDVVINLENFHAEAIRQQVATHSQITLHSRLPSLAPLMVKADLAIGGGGATSWERCCLGLPTLVVTLAENQKPATNELNRRKLIRWLGHKDKTGEMHITQALRNILNEGLKPEWSGNCRSVVDGQGVVRVCDVLFLR